MRYKLVSSDTLRGLEIEVNKAIDEGWEPIGGVVIQPKLIMPEAVQTMFLRRDKKQLHDSTASCDVCGSRWHVTQMQSNGFGYLCPKHSSGGIEATMI